MDAFDNVAQLRCNFDAYQATFGKMLRGCLQILTPFQVGPVYMHVNPCMSFLGPMKLMPQLSHSASCW